MRLTVLFVLMLFFGCPNSYGQIRPIRFSTEFNLGVPLVFASLPSAISAYGGLGFRYNVTTAFSIQGSLNLGSLSGNSKLPNSGFKLPDRVDNYSGFKAHFYNYTLRGSLNLERVFRLRQIPIFHRINPYVVGGAGWTKTRGEDIVAARYNLTPKVYNNLQFWTLQGGLVVRYYVTPLIDFQVGSEIHITQTFYLDGIFADKKFDHYLLNYVGVNLKLGSHKKRQHIEWNNVILPEKKPRYQKMERIREPFVQPMALVDSVSVVSNDSVQTLSDSVVASSPVISDSTLKKETNLEMGKNPIIDSSKTAISAKVDAVPVNSAIIASAIIAKKQTDSGVKTQSDSLGDRLNNNTQSGSKSVGLNTQVRSTPRVSKTIKAVNSSQTIAKNNGLTKKEVLRKPQQTQNYLTPANEPFRRFKANEDNDSKTLNLMDAIASKPLTTYTVIVGAFSQSKIKNAIIFRDRLRRQGYQAALLQSDRNPDIVRIMIYATESKAVALQQCFKARNEIDQKSWILKSK